jgi:HK97 family phage prohead protease
MKTATIPTQERRYATQPLEIRAEGGEDSRKIRGYAAVFGKESSNLGTEERQFIEIIERGAFDDVLNDNTVALFNHDSNFPLARSNNGKGTLSLGVDESGLWYSFDMPHTRAGDDILESIRRGDVESSSFAFTIARGGEQWSESRDGDAKVFRRSITKVARLHDISIVVSPAYPDATVALRSLDEFRKESEPPATDPLPPEKPTSEERWHPLIGRYQTEATTETN